jgi:hypothetical protein
MAGDLAQTSKGAKKQNKDEASRKSPAISQVFGKNASIVNVFRRSSIFAFSHHFRFC